MSRVPVPNICGYMWYGAMLSLCLFGDFNKREGGQMGLTISKLYRSVDYISPMWIVPYMIYTRLSIIILHYRVFLWFSLLEWGQGERGPQSEYWYVNFEITKNSNNRPKQPWSKHIYSYFALISDAKHCTQKLNIKCHLPSSFVTLILKCCS